MIDGKFKTIMVVGVTLAALAGCQSSGNQQVAAKAMAVKKAGEKLGGGFTAGMTPEMTCQVFNKYYKIRHSSNTLCRKVSGSGANSSSEFANATIINYNIDMAASNEQVINTMVFYFSPVGKLNHVVAVDDPSPKRLEQKAHVDGRIHAVAALHY